MYELMPDGTVLRTTDNASIPADPRNIDYQAYLEWVQMGNTAKAAS